ncbi:MAG: DUF2807 domain-containing protein [Bacteroidales bacterium]|nr:DUF2807 domain-containing protein [Bacteroidales bacterium]
MKKIIFISITIILLFASCERHERIRPSGQLVTQSFTFSKITGIDIGNNAVVYINISEDIDDHIHVTVDDNVRPYLDVDLSRENVMIRFRHVSFIGRQPTLHIALNVKNLKQLGLSGATACQIEDVLTCENLKINLSGASELRGEIEVHTISATLSGASKIRLVGECKEFNLTLSGASDMSGYDMVCDDLKANFSGASSASITVLNNLSAVLSGASTLRYDGNPTIVKSNLSGASTLRKR